MNAINLQYYAQLREQAGTSSEQRETDARTLRDLYAELQQIHNFSLPVTVLKVAVNGEFADWDRAVMVHDNVVFIPPVAGG